MATTGVQNHKGGWKQRYDDFTRYATAAWHPGHMHAIILKLRGHKGYFIFPYAMPGSGKGVDYSQYHGPFKTLTAAKVRLLLGNVEYRPNQEYQDD